MILSCGGMFFSLFQMVGQSHLSGTDPGASWLMYILRSMSSAVFRGGFGAVGGSCGMFGVMRFELCDLSREELDGGLVRLVCFVVEVSEWVH